MDMVRVRQITFDQDHQSWHQIIGGLLRFSQSLQGQSAAILRSAIKRQFQDDTAVAFSLNVANDLLGTAQALLNDSSVAPAEMPFVSRVYASMDRALHRRPTWAAG